MTDYPPQFTLTREQASMISRYINVSNADIFITGYAEFSDGKIYSSCLLQDGEYEYNLRKKYPFHDEISIISGGDPSKIILPLSIGRTYIFICNDVTVELPTIRSYLDDNEVQNIIMISAMAMNFEKWKDKLLEIKLPLLISDRFNGTNVFMS